MYDETSTEVAHPQVVELVQRAEIDMQIATAKKYPRDLARVKKKMLDFATLDEDTAESCFYSVPREGKTIQGPSVRLAEIAVACYGNLRAAARIVDNDGKTITSQGVCHDLESNTLISMEVKRRITTKAGKTYSEDMQVTAGNAANAISFRNAVFKVIPGALWKSVYDEARKVAVGDATTLTAKRDKFIKRLNSMGVQTAMILAKLEKTSIETIGLADLEILIGLGTAIKDGDISIEEAFLGHAKDGSSEDAAKAAADKAAALRAKGGTVTEVKSTPKPETAKPEPTVEPVAEQTTGPTGFEATDDDLPEMMQGSSEATEPVEPAWLTDLRGLEVKMKAAKKGGLFRDLLDKHKSERIEDVDEATASALICDIEDALAQVAPKPTNGKLKLL